MLHNDVVIIGGGPIGLSMAILLAKYGKQVIVLNRNNVSLNDGRVLAMSYASYKFLDSINSWKMSDATAIKTVHMSHSGLGISNMYANDLNIEQLGFTIKYTDLCDRLNEEVLKNKNIKLIEANVLDIQSQSSYTYIEYEDQNMYKCNITCDLAIVAEGGRLKINNVEYDSYDYEKHAIIARLKMSTKYANDIAYERFDDSGSMVFLPYENDYVLVWSVSNESVTDFMKPEYLYSRLKQLSFINRFHDFTLDEKVHAFPLKLQVAKNRAFQRLILVGNSSQIVHPVSAQGLNLGFRDCIDLEVLIKRMSSYDEVVQNYDSYREKDAKRVVGFTHFLARFIDKPQIRHFRGLGMIGLSNCQKLQNFVARSLIFGA